MVIICSLSCALHSRFELKVAPHEHWMCSPVCTVSVYAALSWTQTCSSHAALSWTHFFSV